MLRVLLLVSLAFQVDAFASDCADNNVVADWIKDKVAGEFGKTSSDNSTCQMMVSNGAISCSTTKDKITGAMMCRASCSLCGYTHGQALELISNRMVSGCDDPKYSQFLEGLFASPLGDAPADVLELKNKAELIHKVHCGHKEDMPKGYQRQLGKAVYYEETKSFKNMNTLVEKIGASVDQATANLLHAKYVRRQFWKELNHDEAAYLAEKLSKCDEKCAKKDDRCESSEKEDCAEKKLKCKGKCQDKFGTEAEGYTPTPTPVPATEAEILAEKLSKCNKKCKDKKDADKVPPCKERCEDKFGAPTPDPTPAPTSIVFDCVFPACNCDYTADDISWFPVACV